MRKMASLGLALLALASLCSPAMADPVSVSFPTETVTAAVGNVVDVRLNVSEGTGITSADFLLTYDPAIVSLTVDEDGGTTDITAGTLNTAWDVTPYVDTSYDPVQVWLSVSKGSHSAAHSGLQSIVDLAFHVVALGTTALTVTPSEYNYSLSVLYGLNEGAIASTTANGSLTIVPEPSSLACLAVLLTAVPLASLWHGGGPRERIISESAFPSFWPPSGALGISFQRSGGVCLGVPPAMCHNGASWQVYRRENQAGRRRPAEARCRGSALAELERAVRAADPAAMLVLPRILRRVIKQDRGLTGFGLRVPHRKGYAIGRDALLQIVEKAEIGLATDAVLPEKVILLARPGPQRLADSSAQDLLVRCWRLLFHARIHLALEAKLASGTCGAGVRLPWKRRRDACTTRSSRPRFADGFNASARPRSTRSARCWGRKTCCCRRGVI